MHPSIHKPPRPQPQRLREYRAFPAPDGACSAIYDIERTLVFSVPARLRRRITNGLARPANGDHAITRWLVEEDLLTRDPHRQHAPSCSMLPAITDVSLDVAGTCNMACTYCFERQIPSRLGPMSHDTLGASVRFAFSISGKAQGITFHFGSGEPLVRFDLIKAVVETSDKLAQSTGKRVNFELTTNGSLVTDEIAQFLRDHLFTVRVSCDGPPHIHDRSRRMPGGGPSYAVVERGIALLLKHLGDRLTINSVICAETRLLELWRWVKQLGVRRYHVIKVGVDNSSTVRLCHRALEEFTSDTADICSELYQELSGGGVPIDYQPITKVLWRLIVPRPINRFCGVATTYIGVGSNGDIYPCFRHLGLAAYKLGDVRHSIDDTKRVRFVTQVAAHVDARPVCCACWARYLCGGGCYADSVCCTATPSTPITLHCDFWRAEIEAAVRLFARLATAAPSSLLRLFDCQADNLGGTFDRLLGAAKHCG